MNTLSTALLAAVLLLPLAPTAAADCTDASALPLAAATVCGDDGVDVAYDVFVPSDRPTVPILEGVCVSGTNVRGGASSSATADVTSETGMRCLENGRWTHRDYNNDNTIRLGVVDGDGDGTGDAFYASVCREWGPVVIDVHACADVPGEKNGLARVFVPTEVWIEDGMPCARMAVVDARYEGDGTAPDADAGVYENFTVWCVSDHPGIRHHYQSPSPMVVAGVRDSDGDGVADEPHASSPYLP